MLRSCVSRRNALCGLPEREARLLWFGRRPGEGDEEDHGGPDHGGGRDPVERGQGQQRDRVRGALDHGEHGNQSEAQRTLARLREVEQKLRDGQRQIREIIAAERDTPGLRRFREQNPDVWHRMTSDETFIAAELVNLAAYREKADFLARWDRGDVNPLEFQEWLEENHPVNYRDDRAQEGRIRVLGNVAGYIQGTAGNEPGGDPPNLTRPEYWQHISGGNRTLIIQELGARGEVPELLAYLNDRAQIYDEAFAQAELPAIIAAASTLAHGHQAHQPGHEGEQAPDHGGMNLQWFSINQIIGGMKQWKDAFMKAWQDHDHHKSASFGKKVGRMMRWLPYGDVAERQMDQEVESHNRKLKNEFKEYLDERKPKFQDVFGAGGHLDQNLHDPNRCMGVLEYAASRGWLYKMNETASRNIYGHDFTHLVDHDWDANQVAIYWENLRSQNERGANEEQGKAKTKTEKFDKADQFLDFFNREMGNCNFWAAIGVAEAFIGRGKDGATSALIATNYLRWLREDDSVREFIPDVVTERLPFPVWHRGYFTAAHLTMDKGKIREWLRTGNKSSLEGAGQLAGAIQRLENYVREHSRGDIDAGTMSKIVGELLAANTVKAPGTDRPLSIFDAPGLKDYRTSPELFKYFKDIDPGKDIADYYSSPSEVVLASETYMTQLFEPITSGKGFKHTQKVAAFVGQMILRYEDLRDGGLADAAATYLQEMKGKLNTAMKTLSSFGGMESIAQMQWTMWNRNGPMLASMLHYGFIDDSIIGTAQETVRRQLSEVRARARLTPTGPSDNGQEPGGGQH